MRHLESFSNTVTLHRGGTDHFYNPISNVFLWKA
eukprot:06818.XXX_119537_119638_1 [CDS] Oithona nana genome sequencing.